MYNDLQWRDNIAAPQNLPATALLILLVTCDAFFVAINVLLAAKGVDLDVSSYSLGVDAGYPELFQYAKWLAIVLLLTGMAASRKFAALTPWIFVFAYFLIDDSLRVHELIGAQFEEHFSFPVPFGLRMQDVGELTATAGFAMVLAVPFAVTFFKGAFKLNMLTLALIASVLSVAFFGVLVDMIAISFDGGRYSELFFLILEDGGEMVVASLTVWFVFLSAQSSGTHNM